MEVKKINSFNPMAIGEEIRRCRRALDMTQKELCNGVLALEGDIKLSQREVSMLEKGTGNPTLNKLEAISKVLSKEWKLQ